MGGWLGGWVIGWVDGRHILVSVVVVEVVVYPQFDLWSWFPVVTFLKHSYDIRDIW